MEKQEQQKIIGEHCKGTEQTLVPVNPSPKYTKGKDIAKENWSKLRETQLKYLETVLFVAHNFVGLCKIKRVHVSIRDIMCSNCTNFSKLKFCQHPTEQTMKRHFIGILLLCQLQFLTTSVFTNFK